jgi:hypothetical protein
MHIISGGQTGVDQAALDAAIALGLSYSGWIPAKRWTEDGVLSPRFQNMRETDSEDPKQRTEWNVRDSDGTLLFSHGPLMGGSHLTYDLATKHYHRPCLHVDLSSDVTRDAHVVKRVRDWLNRYRIENLNVAGPRCSEDPLIYQHVKSVLLSVLGNNEMRSS